MAEAIYVAGSDGDLLSIKRTSYSLETDLQELVEKHPELLPGDQMDPEAPRRWRLIRREAPVSSATSRDRWHLDHLLVDQDAIPTLVEAKRGGNPEARREVVAQLLEYAANGTLHWPPGELKSWFEQRHHGDEEAAIRSIGSLLGDPDLEAEAYEDFWTSVDMNLEERKVRLVFVADEIPSELKTLVEFLNDQMKVIDVFAVEVIQYADGKRQILRPQLVGQTEKNRATKGPRGSSPQRDRPWSEEEVIKALDPTDRPLAERILAWARDEGLVMTGGHGAFRGHLMGRVLVSSGAQAKVFRITAGLPSQFFAVTVKRMSEHAPFDSPAERATLVARLVDLGARLATDDATKTATAFFDDDVLRITDRLRAVLEFLSTCVARMKSGGSQAADLIGSASPAPAHTPLDS